MRTKKKIKSKNISKKNKFLVKTNVLIKNYWKNKYKLQ